MCYILVKNLNKKTAKKRTFYPFFKPLDKYLGAFIKNKRCLVSQKVILDNMHIFNRLIQSIFELKNELLYLYIYIIDITIYNDVL